MTALAWLIPIALLLGGLGLAAFLWSLKSGQYDDLEGAAWRALMDDDAEEAQAAQAGAARHAPLQPAPGGK
jgi:cbb3-type cytochrome oxidase maturation protein